MHRTHTDTSMQCSLALSCTTDRYNEQLLTYHSNRQDNQQNKKIIYITHARQLYSSIKEFLSFYQLYQQYKVNSAFHPSEVDKWVAGLYNQMCAVAPSAECSGGKSPLDRMLAIPWRRLFLAAFGLNLVVVAVLHDSRVIGCCPAWQIVVRLSILS